MSLGIFGIINCGAILEKSETLSETLNETIDNMIEVTLIGYEEKNDRYYERLRDNYYNIIIQILFWFLHPQPYLNNPNYVFFRFTFT